MTSKVPFILHLKLTRTKRKSTNYENVHNETSVYEQKPIKIDEFNVKVKESRLKKENKKEERLPKTINYKKKKKKKRKKKKMRKNYGIN